MKPIFLTLILLTCFLTHVHALPQHSPVPGGVALVAVKGHFEEKPIIHYRNKPVIVIPEPNASTPSKWLAVVGLPLSIKPGQHHIRIQSPKNTGRQAFTVNDKKYEEQRITIKNQDHVSPKQQQLTRIRKESQQIKDALTHYDAKRIPKHLNLVWPVDGRHSGRFGLKRFFNDQPRSPHSGYDIAAPEGTKITAPLDGTVTLVGDFFFTGNFVVIDHGQGFQTLYAHMHTTDVTEGQHVKLGEPIGSVGTTGRSTGPHLHWGVILNGAKVDPSLFVE